jgi:putative CocE/NonD family hydrolase
MYLCVRGSGTSEGIPTDEYAVDECEDTARVIDWFSKQPWSNGNIGMYGASYSAFNSVWVAAALKPPALKAIFVRAGTDNRYTDDVHFPGGTMVMVNNAWALGMLTSNATPGAPDFDMHSKASMDRWNTPPWLQVFLRNQLDGPHWQRGSLWPDYKRLTTPTFLSGGYLDKYQNFVPRIMRNSPAPSKGILGPWHHSMTWPGPVLDWNALQIRWFDQWLKGQDTGIMREPKVSFFLPDWRRQTFRFKDPIPGEWRHLDEWPDTVFAPTKRFYLRPDPEVSVVDAMRTDPAPGMGGSMAEMSGNPSALRLTYYPGRGGSDQSFGPTGSNGYYGIDSREEDPYGLCFDTTPLRSPVEILGFVRAKLFVSCTAPVANWVVRVHDVAPDGTSYLVARGYLNGTHRRSHTHPEPLVAGEVYEIDVELMATGYRFPVGHRIRTIVTNADFPVIWPSPYAMTTTLYTGGDRPSFISLPVLPSLQYRSGSLPVLGQSLAEVRGNERSGDSVRSYSMTRDYGAGVVSARFDLGRNIIECKVNEANPGEASLHLTANVQNTAADGRQIETRAVGTLSSTVDRFIMDMECTLLENGKVIRTRRWEDNVPRQLL